jgi:hypothetical protein
VKTIELKIVERAAGEPWDYREVIKNVINGVDPREGLSVDEMRKRLRVVDALEACDGPVLELEDADYELLARKVREMKWIVVDRVIVDFCDDIANAADAKAKPPRKQK